MGLLISDIAEVANQRGQMQMRINGRPIVMHANGPQAKAFVAIQALRDLVEERADVEGAEPPPLPPAPPVSPDLKRRGLFSRIMDRENTLPPGLKMKITPGPSLQQLRGKRYTPPPSVPASAAHLRAREAIHGVGYQPIERRLVGFEVNDKEVTVHLTEGTTRIYPLDNPVLKTVLGEVQTLATAGLEPVAPEGRPATAQSGETYLAQREDGVVEFTPLGKERVWKHILGTKELIWAEMELADAKPKLMRPSLNRPDKGPHVFVVPMSTSTVEEVGPDENQETVTQYSAQLQLTTEGFRVLTPEGQAEWPEGSLEKKWAESLAIKCSEAVAGGIQRHLDKVPVSPILSTPGQEPARVETVPELPAPDGPLMELAKFTSALPEKLLELKSRRQKLERQAWAQAGKVICGTKLQAGPPPEPPQGSMVWPLHVPGYKIHFTGDRFIVETERGTSGVLDTDHVVNAARPIAASFEMLNLEEAVLNHGTLRRQEWVDGMYKEQRDQYEADMSVAPAMKASAAALVSLMPLREVQDPESCIRAIESGRLLWVSASGEQSYYFDGRTVVAEKVDDNGIKTRQICASIDYLGYVREHFARLDELVVKANPSAREKPNVSPEQGTNLSAYSHLYQIDLVNARRTQTLNEQKAERAASLNDVSAAVAAQGWFVPMPEGQISDAEWTMLGKAEVDLPLDGRPEKCSVEVLFDGTTFKARTASSGGAYEAYVSDEALAKLGGSNLESMISIEAELASQENLYRCQRKACADALATQRMLRDAEYLAECRKRTDRSDYVFKEVVSKVEETSKAVGEGTPASQRFAEIADNGQIVHVYRDPSGAPSGWVYVSGEEFALEKDGVLWVGSVPEATSLLGKSLEYPNAGSKAPAPVLVERVTVEAIDPGPSGRTPLLSVIDQGDATADVIIAQDLAEHAVVEAARSDGSIDVMLGEDQSTGEIHIESVVDEIGQEIPLQEWSEETEPPTSPVENESVALEANLRVEQPGVGIMTALQNSVHNSQFGSRDSVETPNTMANEILGSSDFSLLETHCGEDGLAFTGRTLGSSPESITLESTRGTAIHLAIGEIQQREDLPQMLRTTQRQVGCFLLEESEIVVPVPSNDSPAIDEIVGILRSEGYDISGGQLANALWETIDGRVYVKDHGALMKRRVAPLSAVETTPPAPAPKTSLPWLAPIEVQEATTEVDR